MKSNERPAFPACEQPAVRLDRLRHSLVLLQRAAGVINDGVAPIDFGIAEIDNALGGGLARGALHEVAAAGESAIAAATDFSLGLAARALSKSASTYDLVSLNLSSPTAEKPRERGRSQRESSPAKKTVLWIAESLSVAENGLVYGPGLDQAGIAPQCLIMVTARRTRDVLWAMEEALRCRAVGVVIGELRSDIDPVTIRRLSHAAATGDTLGLVLRAHPYDAPSAFATRWVVAPMQSAIVVSHPEKQTGHKFHDLGPPRLLVRLNRNRRGHLGQWIVEWNSVEQRFKLTTHSEPMVRPLFDRSHRAAAG
jgi:protein ImuA